MLQKAWKRGESRNRSQGQSQGYLYQAAESFALSSGRQGFVLTIFHKSVASGVPVHILVSRFWRYTRSVVWSLLTFSAVLWLPEGVH